MLCCLGSGSTRATGLRTVPCMKSKSHLTTSGILVFLKLFKNTVLFKQMNNFKRLLRIFCATEQAAVSKVRINVSRMFRGSIYSPCVIYTRVSQNSDIPATCVATLKGWDSAVTNTGNISPKNFTRNKRIKNRQFS
jgi:hypothetical protein